MIYEDFKRNHVILPGRDNMLEEFLKQDYKGMQHKWKNGFNSQSEDALTWSCFDVLSNLPLKKKIFALNRIFEDSYQDRNILKIEESQNQIKIHVGKQYTGSSTNESTEVDASIELPGKLVFIEAKLYSSVSTASPPSKPHDQIARKLRIGLDSPLNDSREFYFIFLDIAPVDKLYMHKSKEEALAQSSGDFKDKWRSAWIYKYYKHGRNNSLRPLAEALEGINAPSVESVSKNMGWLSWSDLFKTVLQGSVSE